MSPTIDAVMPALWYCSHAGWGWNWYWLGQSIFCRHFWACFMLSMLTLATPCFSTHLHLSSRLHFLLFLAYSHGLFLCQFSNKNVDWQLTLADSWPSCWVEHISRQLTTPNSSFQNILWTFKFLLMPVNTDSADPGPSEFKSFPHCCGTLLNKLLLLFVPQFPHQWKEVIIAFISWGYCGTLIT